MVKIAGKPFKNLKHEALSIIAKSIIEVSGHTPTTLLRHRERRLMHTAAWALEQLVEYYSEQADNETAPANTRDFQEALEKVKTVKALVAECERAANII